MSLGAKTYAGHYTLNEWEKWNDQWELIDGVPYCMSPAPTVKHQSINSKIITQLQNLLSNCKTCNAYMPIDWVINDDTVVQPDALVVCKEITTPRLHFAPSLIFEVLSPSTERKDRTEKFELYQSQKVRYYILVNPDNKSIEVYLLESNVYKKQKETPLFTFELEGCTLNFNFDLIW